MGLVGMALGAMYTRADAVLMTPEAFVKRPIEWLRAISRYRGTISFAPNFAYDLAVRRVKDADLADLDLSSWRVAGCGAEPIHASTLAAFADKFRAGGFRDTSFLPSYGLAEHVLAATMSPRGRGAARRAAVGGRRDRQARGDAAANGTRAKPSQSWRCGTPLPGHEVRIVDEQRPSAARAAHRRDRAERAVRDPGLLQ